MHCFAKQCISNSLFVFQNNIFHNNNLQNNIFVDKNVRLKLYDYDFYVKIANFEKFDLSINMNVIPEKLISKETTKVSDVYSYAMIEFEMLTKEKFLILFKTIDSCNN